KPSATSRPMATMVTAPPPAPAGVAEMAVLTLRAHPMSGTGAPAEMASAEMAVIDRPLRAARRAGPSVVTTELLPVEPAVVISVPCWSANWRPICCSDERWAANAWTLPILYPTKRIPIIDGGWLFEAAAKIGVATPTIRGDPATAETYTFET